MKREEFPLNDRDFRITYCRTREGPNGFITFYKNAAGMQTDPLEAWRTLGIARFTDTGKALKKWCLEMYEQYGDEAKEEESQVKAEFFDYAPDAA